MLHFSKEVARAREANLPIVALESTIVAHGMPFPQNLQTGRELEEILRQEGATPATIAVIEGKVCIGLEGSQLEQVARHSEKEPVIKLSTKDLPYALSQKKTGATTVAATMALAHQAGIELFVTGGIGGVHRGWQQTLDVSADLKELSRTPVAVVCAGAKSLLDIPATLEVLETYGVPVIGYQCEQFPAFYSRESGGAVDFSLHTPESVAQLVKANRELATGGGMVIGVPLPYEAELPREWMEKIIEEALEEAQQKGVKGKAVTPFLLQAVVQRTEGKSLEANRALVKNNARVGAKIATASI